jgi:glutathione S-transferase
MKLYEFPPTRSIRVRWTLQELGIDFEAITVNILAGEHLEPPFRQINPAGKIPVLVDGDFVLTESVAIVLYLADKFPQPRRLAPSESGQRAELNRWLLFTVTELEQPLWRMARHGWIYPESDRQAGDIPIAQREFAQMAAVLDRHMTDRQYVVGDSVTVADFVLAYTLDWAGEEQLLGGFPRLRSYMERMYARPRAAPRIAQAMASVGMG